MTIINTDCLFCNIVAGKIPAEKVYEDDIFIAFLDIHPRGPGHVQVIPKEHHRWVWDVPQIDRYFTIVRDIAQAQRKAFDTQMIRSQVFGDEVPHAHVWVWPHIEANKNDIAGNAEKLRSNIRQA